MANPVSPDERARIRELHDAGKSCTAIAKDLGRAVSTISKICRQEGLTFDTERTAPATENRVEQNRHKRAVLESRLLDEAGLLLDQLHRPHLVYSFGGRDNTYAEHQLAEPDVGAKRSLIQAATTATQHALKLAEADKAGAGAEAGKSMVGALFAAFRVTPPDDDETPAESESGEQE